MSTKGRDWKPSDLYYAGKAFNSADVAITALAQLEDALSALDLPLPQSRVVAMYRYIESLQKDIATMVEHGVQHFDDEVQS